ncbi:hypothetical protein A2686_01845 [Candidatus Woesebacteria bacterium RIFCSPHIGHO2_01_FULL_38_10]|nr:MAG: hypothetical protein A2686_01845 [Candidatus Woesebacteria bacterium RIFCSPHIGHO2_01_FULL_38_10]
MKDFNFYLEQIGEIGFTEEIVHSIVYVSGLPQAKPSEVVMFESGEIGQVLSLGEDLVEVLLLTRSELRVGTKVVRTDELLQVPVGESLLGRAFDPLVKPIDDGRLIGGLKVSPIDTQPHGIIGRKQVSESLETGVTIVDLIIPLAKGQRELVIGDRKTGKTGFLLQVMLTQARMGTVCIYCVIGQRLIDIKNRFEFMEEMGIKKNCLIVATSSSDAPGLIFLTPYSAMTIAEFFRDQGKDVLLILDDMTTHARYYREISLLAKRFPGRSSYPGDIFYTQAKLIERAGNYKKGSITCLPVAEAVLGDLSGYIQTNLMSMTDGHIFFDIDLYNQGRRPAVNPFLSVTRSGHQVQTFLQQDLGRKLTSFLVEYEKMKEFMHFGAEAGETVQNVIELGRKLDIFFNQPLGKTIPVNANILLAGGLWSGVWRGGDDEDFKRKIEEVILNYETNKGYKTKVDELIKSCNKFTDLVNSLRMDSEVLGVAQKI